MMAHFFPNMGIFCFHSGHVLPASQAVVSKQIANSTT
jgi:hypothetical protein